MTPKRVLEAPATDRAAGEQPARVPDGSVRPWRVVLAHDLSPGAELATTVIADATWPPGTTVLLATSTAGVGPMLSSFAYPNETRAHARTVRQLVAAAHDSAAARLGDAGLMVEPRIVGGAPAEAIVREARRIDADLIVVGARDQGAIAAAVLGSVSRSIVERARCSVLVVRGGRLARVLVATDASAAATAAVRLAASAPFFTGAHIRVLSVGEGPPAVKVAALDGPSSAEPPPAAIDGTRHAAALAAEDAAANAVAALAATGCDVHSEVRLGDPATEIVGAAREWLPDVVVIGSNGQPLLRRLFLGSVTRKVIDGVRSSVLVARPPEDRMETSDPS